MAAGKGTRINSHKINKVALPFLGKPLISYGVNLFKGMVNPLIIVVGAYSESVKKVLKGVKVVYADQKKRLGTGHGVKVGLEVLEKYSPTPEAVLVGYGDHMMFYKKETVKKLINLHAENSAAVSLITVKHNSPDELAWGRIIRDSAGYIIDNIEQRDATAAERKIGEINAGFYCFDYEFLNKNIDKIKKSPKSGEYYVNSLIQIAVKQCRKVIGLKVPFEEVGIGINKSPELQISQKLYLQD